MAARVKKRPAKAATPLDARYLALLAKEENLRQQKERAQHAVDQAPIRKALQDKRRREELITRSSRDQRSDFPRSLNSRFDAVLSSSLPSATRPRRALRAERRHARIKFCGLFFGLLLLLVWLYSVWRW